MKIETLNKTSNENEMNNYDRGIWINIEWQVNVDNIKTLGWPLTKLREMFKYASIVICEKKNGKR